MTVLSASKLTIPSGKVASDLTDFIVRVDLSDMPASFWAVVDVSGATIRVLNSSLSVIPFDIVNIDTGTETGRLFFKSSLATASDNVFHIIVDDALGAIDPGDPNGRNDVWSDYEVALAFSSLTNRNGNGSDATLIGDAALSGGEVSLDGTGDGVRVTPVSTFTVWTLGLSLQPDVNPPSTTVNIVRYYDEEGDITGTQSQITQATSPNVWAFVDSNNGTIGDITPSAGVRRRLNAAFNGTTARHLWVNGGNKVTDSTVVQKPGAGSDYFGLGNRTSSAIASFDGVMDYAYLRNGLLSDDWIAAEYASWETPDAFYNTITEEVAKLGKLIGYSILASPAERAMLGKIMSYSVLSPGGGGGDWRDTYPYFIPVVT